MRDLIYDRVEHPDALENYVKGVVRGNYTSLIILGRGGTGKSTVVRKHFAENNEDDIEPRKNKGAYWKKGRISPVKFYQHLYQWKDCNIVLDDAPNLERNLPLAGLLRQLCETEDVRRVSWDTQNNKLQEDGIPSSFRTRSKFILISNRWMGRHEEVEALETRVPIVVYEPGVGLIHSQAVAAMKDGLRNAEGHLRFEPEVVKYIGRAIKESRVHALNLRDYILASNQLRNGDCWKEMLEKKILPDVLEEMPDDADFILGWMRRMGKDRVSEGELYRKTKRFRGEYATKSDMIDAFKWLTHRSKLVEINPYRPGSNKPGRPMSKEYALPSFKVVSSPKMTTKRNIAGSAV